jgi:UDP-N-acetylglucosamine 4,6-dehydratase
VIGMRPGEKLHETLITVDEARQAVDTGDSYVIEPSFPWWSSAPHQGRRMPDDFSYTSANAPERLSVEALRTMLRGLGY